MSIVKIKNQSGITYAYEATSHYDPVKKQSRPTRKYLGRVDEETGEIIPTEGRRGRAKKKPSSDDDYKARYAQAASALKKAEEEIEMLRKENSELAGANAQLMEAVSSIYGTVSGFIGK